jgi:hypothetical protein
MSLRPDHGDGSAVENRISRHGPHWAEVPNGLTRSGLPLFPLNRNGCLASAALDALAPFELEEFWRIQLRGTASNGGRLR